MSNQIKKKKKDHDDILFTEIPCNLSRFIIGKITVLSKPVLQEYKRKTQSSSAGVYKVSPNARRKRMSRSLKVWTNYFIFATNKDVASVRDVRGKRALFLLSEEHRSLVKIFPGPLTAPGLKCTVHSASLLGHLLDTSVNVNLIVFRIWTWNAWRHEAFHISVRVRVSWEYE